MTPADCEAKYGLIVNGVWEDEVHHCVLLELPPLFGIKVLNSANGGPWKRVYCNRDMSGPLTAALENVARRGCLSELYTFDGCFEIRDTRGMPGRPSAHSWAMAIDLNAKTNPLGGASSWSPEFVQCFKDAGFTWGGDFSRPDPMHFSLAGF